MRDLDKTPEGRFVVCLGDPAHLPGPGRREGLIDRLSAQLGCEVLDLTVDGAGLDAYLRSQRVQALARRAEAVVLVAPPLLRQSNPFYRVQRLQNHRLLTTTGALETLYPDRDDVSLVFAETLMERLVEADPGKAEAILDALGDTWVIQMGALVLKLSSPVHLLIPQAIDEVDLQDRVNALRPILASTISLRMGIDKVCEMLAAWVAPGFEWKKADP